MTNSLIQIGKLTVKKPLCDGEGAGVVFHEDSRFDIEAPLPSELIKCFEEYDHESAGH